MNCPTHDELLAYATGRLDEQSSETLAEHLRACETCQTRLDTVDDSQDSLLARLRRTPDADAYEQEAQCEQAAQLAAALVPATAGKAATVSRPASWAGGDAESPPTLPSDDPRGQPAVVAGSTADLVRELGEYELLEKLGQGGMGAVYKARHRRLDKIVAVKVLPPERMADPLALARFDREMKAVGRLDHPNIVRAMDAREIDGMHFLAMEYVAGMDLGDVVLHVGTLRIADACEVVRQIAAGLQCAHENGLVHRDIKPSNAILTTAGQVKLLDLGLARLSGGTANVEAEAGRGEMTSSGTAMGTADYMAPEQASDSHTADIRADIYSLGCTLYTLLSGRPPFSGPKYKTPLQKIMGHMRDAPPPIDSVRTDVSAELAAVLDGLMAKDRDARYATPQEVIDALTPFVTGANLARLYCEADAMQRGEPRPEPSVVGTEPGAPSARPRVSKSPRFLLPRSVVLIALAFLGVAVLAGVIVIRIVQKSGKETVVEIPDGDLKSVTIEERPGGQKTGHIMFILDCSGSMQERGRMRNVKSSMQSVLGSLLAAGRYEVGLRAYGRRAKFTDPRDCAKKAFASPEYEGIVHPDLDVELMLPIQTLDRAHHAALLAKVADLQPLGQTPVYLSLKLAFAEGDFAHVPEGEPKRLIVITDGLNFQTNCLRIENRPERPTTMQEVLAARKAAGKSRDIPIDIIGLDMDETRDQLAELIQLAEQTGGRYYDARNTENLIQVLRQTLWLIEYTVTEAGAESDGRTRRELGESSLPQLPPQPARYEVQLPGLDSAVRESVQIEGGETLLLRYDGRRGRLFYPPVTQPAAIPGLRSWSVLPATHRDSISAIACSPNGGFVAVAGDDGENFPATVRVWGLGAPQNLGFTETTGCSVLLGHDKKIDALAWSPNGKYLASTGQDLTVKCWEPATGRLLRSFLLNSPGYALAWSPSGDRLAVACGTAITLIDIKSGELREVPNTESKGGIAWLPDGKRFLVQSSAGTTATLTVYDAELLELDRSIRTEELTGRSASLSPDGKRIAATYADKLVRVWDVESCERIQELTAEAGEVVHVAWSPAGDRLATVGKALIVWDAAKSERLATVKLESAPLGVAWSADGRHVAVGLPTAVDLYSAADAALTDTLTVTGRLPAAKLAITPDGRYRAVGPIADQLVYVALTDDYRQVTYTPASFAEKHGWKN